MTSITTVNKIKKYKYLFLLMLPGILYYIIFHYIPMFGIVIAFQDYKPWDGIMNSAWVGFKNFNQFFKSYYFLRLIRNTLFINGLKLVFGFPMPIIFALLLNEVENKIFKKSIQSVSYFPNFMSWIIAVGLMVNLFSPSVGIINMFLVEIGHEPINFMLEQKYFLPLVIGSSVWKSFGWGSIIYLAAISGVDVQLYDSAVVDGAGRLRQAFHITLPSLMPAAVILLIFSVGAALGSDFEQLLAMMGDKASLYEVGDVIDTYVYREGMLYANYSLAAAVGVFKGFVGLILIFGVNWLANKFGQKGIW